MRRIALLALAILFLAPVLASAPAHAQATRTWVSGVGDDVNPCSRTAPCKTFAGAISKTAAGGEINCLDPGGFGAVTITKAITLNCGFTLGSILASGTPGIIINAAAADRITLRGLQFAGHQPIACRRRDHRRSHPCGGRGHDRGHPCPQAFASVGHQRRACHRKRQALHPEHGDLEQYRNRHQFRRNRRFQHQVEIDEFKFDQQSRRHQGRQRCHRDGPALGHVRQHD